MPFAQEADNYRAFLLRLWRDGAGAPWHATLEDTHQGTKKGFGDMQQLIAYIEEVTGESTTHTIYLEGDQSHDQT